MRALICDLFGAISKFLSKLPYTQYLVYYMQ
jgi:hypothetical protein